MNYEIKLITKEQQKTSTWSGGTTTQLAIYPENADYGMRNFIWRLSSATVEADESVFTSLPGIERIIMILEGEIILEHEGHYKKVLGKFQQDSFSGSWTTRSIGQATDFNLMMRDGCQGQLEALVLEKHEWRTITFEGKETFENHVQAIYSVKGSIILRFPGQQSIQLAQGDMLLIRNDHDWHGINYEIRNMAENNAEVVIANIYHK
ncbi:HutD/Ves family protein [Lutispora thermophila]|uniref:Various environmental stresses-induced protein Ves n=1 Tax=Lutispora thermophila DSM 19022 TaxID=1122184 RepID=A0A1M6BT96_9FIRM|nr:HutD family protein [Lutispora thermophila]SHI51956.1 Various environmental stresses-induced protein Ves [Lutispora thermophila DSM 19022]